MDCNQDYYHSQYWLWPDYDGNMDTTIHRNNYDHYICSVADNAAKLRIFAFSYVLYAEK